MATPAVPASKWRHDYMQEDGRADFCATLHTCKSGHIRCEMMFSYSDDADWDEFDLLISCSNADETNEALKVFIVDSSSYILERRLDIEWLMRLCASVNTWFSIIDESYTFLRAMEMSHVYSQLFSHLSFASDTGHLVDRELRRWAFPVSKRLLALGERPSRHRWLRHVGTARDYHTGVYSEKEVKRYGKDFLDKQCTKERKDIHYGETTAERLYSLLKRAMFFLEKEARTR